LDIGSEHTGSPLCVCVCVCVLQVVVFV
jgi:hypothetical protein